MRVAIYGAGAMGTLLGAYISASGKQIDLITRNAGQVAALNERGGGKPEFVQGSVRASETQIRNFFG